MRRHWTFRVAVAVTVQLAVTSTWGYRALYQVNNAITVVMLKSFVKWRVFEVSPDVMQLRETGSVTGADWSRSKHPPAWFDVWLSGALFWFLAVAPGFLLALLVYHRISFRIRADGETRCRGCRHILRGLSEPRCPECGIRI